MNISSTNIEKAKDILFENRIKGLKKVENNPKHINIESPEEKAKLAEAARGFEAMFLNMMLKEMKSAMLEEADDQDKFGADTLGGYADMMMTESFSKSGTGVGIAEMIFKQMTGEKLQPIFKEKIAQEKINFSVPQKTVQNLQSNKVEFRNNEVKQTAKVSGNFENRVKQRIDPYKGVIQRASEKFSVPVDLIKAIITAESAGRTNAKSHAGAKGLMQLMDGTAKDLGVTNSFDPKQNIMGGADYISRMIKKFGNVELGLAAYNAGPGNVMKYGGIPPFKETQAYVKRVMRFRNMYQNELASNAE